MNANSEHSDHAPWLAIDTCNCKWKHRALVAAMQDFDGNLKAAIFKVIGDGQLEASGAAACKSA